MEDDQGRRDRVPVDPDLEPSDPEQPSAAHRPSLRPGPRRARPGVLAVVALGGALGACARYGISRLIVVPSGGFPWATFWTNVSGSFVLGFVLVRLVERFPASRHLHPFVVIGFLGGFTTFSTFMVEADLLVKDGHGASAAVYLLASTVAGLCAVWLGILLARYVSRGRGLDGRPASSGARG